MKRFSLLAGFAVVMTLFFSFKPANSPALWMRYPAISPDGKTIVFSYKGDLYKVSATGGNASPLTLSEGHDYMPVWSPDGQWIAFASDRNGNFDVYRIPAEGGVAQRLTYHSASDYPNSFTPDGKTILFTSSRMDQAQYTQFPVGGIPELYSVPAEGGREVQVLTIAAEEAKYNKAGDKLIFHDRKGYEDPWRKHHTSSVARDIWMQDKAANTFTKLSSFEGEDRSPVWSANETSIYFLSEKSGSFNVWKMAVADPGQLKQVTHFDKHPVRFLSCASNDVLCFGFNGEIYTQSGDAEPQKVAITIAVDERFTDNKTETFRDGVTEMSLSPNGKEMVFVVRGEVFVSSSENGTTRRITYTPEQERNVSFSPDGRTILYASERNHIWGLYKMSLQRKEESYFFNSTLLNEETILAGKTEAFQPKFSPDGNEVAYLEERTAVKVINLKTKAVRTILAGDRNYSYSDGDQYFEWSPDGKYILVQFLQEGNWRSEIGLMDAEGKGPLIDLTQSGFSCESGRWMMNGKVMLWQSGRDGMKNIASHGRQYDAYGLFMTKAAYDRFRLNKEDYALLKEKEEKEKEKDKEKDKDKTKKSTTKEDSLKKTAPAKFDLEGLQDRKVRLTIHSSMLADALLSPDGEKLYYLTRFEGGYNLWITKFKENETKMLLKLDAGSVGPMQFDKDAKAVLFVADGKMLKVDLEKGEKKEMAFNAEMNLNLSAERAYLFEHMWRQVVKKFYVTDLQKTDWEFYKQNYERFLPYINNNRDFSEMMSEMLGELNASHTGCGYVLRFKNPEETASLGAFFDDSYTGNGLRILEVIDKGPLDYDGSPIKAGCIIEKINGMEITAGMNYNPLLNRLAGKYTLLTVYDEKTKKRYEETVKPINYRQLNPLLYERWVKRMQKMTEELSGGQLGYMHVKQMDDEAFREFFDQVLGKYANRKALIVDTRFNGGGWMHDDLATFLSGKQYIVFAPRGQRIGGEPDAKWTRPSMVLIGEANYSDAHMFPMVYKTLGIGKLLGMPVPGTGTAVWWETQQDQSLYFGIPQVATLTMDGKYYENNQLEPDVKVMNEYPSMMKGDDQQLKEAVKLLLQQ